MAEHEVTAPAQHRRANLKWIRIGGVVAILILLSMTRPFNNHEDPSGDVFLLFTAALIAALLIGDAVVRRNGLRR